MFVTTSGRSGAPKATYDGTIIYNDPVNVFLTSLVAVRNALGASLRQLDVRNIYNNPVDIYFKFSFTYLILQILK
jgi:hypothetical protein